MLRTFLGHLDHDPAAARLAAEGGSAQMYVLGGSSQSDFSANVNKKVEVTGPVQEPANAGKDAAQDPKVLRPPLIVVESVKVVAPSCT